MSNKKTKNKTESVKTHKTKVAITIVAAIISVIALFLILANSIVVDGCASPCKGHSSGFSCPDVCVEVTLLDRILGNG